MPPPTDILTARALEDLPAYPVPRAARLVRLSRSTLRLWACGDGERKALFYPASRKPLLLSFSNLIEAFVLASMRQVRGNSLPREILEASLQRIDWEDGLAVRLYPQVRGGALAHEPRTIVIDPRRGFGQPSIAGTGIEARIVAGRYRAGESMLTLAEDYGVRLEQIEDAIRCETREAA